MSERPRAQAELEFTVHTYEIDFAGILNNQVYFRWLEDLRQRMLDLYLPLDQALARGFFPVLLETHITYKRAIRMFDHPTGRMWLAEARKVRGVLHAEFHVNGEIAATAQQTYCFVDAKSLRPIPHPPELAGHPVDR